MAFILEPERCPECQTTLTADYEQRRNVGTPPLAIALYAALAVLGVVVVTIGVAILRHLIWPLPLRRREAGLAWLVSCAALTAGIVFLVLRSWRIVERIPVRIEVQCPDCGWKGLCRYAEFVFEEAFHEVLAKKPVSAETTALPAGVDDK